MQIGLNFLHAFPGIGGVWNYMACLINAIGEFDSINSYIVFVNQASQKLVPQKPNFSCVYTKINPRHRMQRVIYENSLLDLKAKLLNVECMHWFANGMALFSRLPGIVTVHDLLVFHHPEIFSETKRLYLKIMLKTTLRKAKVLLPISLSTMSDLKNKINIKHDNVFVLPPVIDSQFKPATNERIRNLKTKYSLPDKYFLYVAHTYPHKNHVRLLYAYHRLKKEGFRPWPLVLRADAKENEAKIRQTIISLNLEKSVIRLPRISQDELSALYSGAGAMIYPSLFEGRGIPVVEAMACGCPIAASTIPAVVETVGNAAFFFDPHSKNNICSAIREIQSDNDLRETLRNKGLKVATNFEGGNIVKTLLLAYKMAKKQSLNTAVK